MRGQRKKRGALDYRRVEDGKRELPGWGTERRVASLAGEVDSGAPGSGSDVGEPGCAPQLSGQSL